MPRAFLCGPAHRDMRRGYLTSLSGDYPAAASRDPTHDRDVLTPHIPRRRPSHRADPATRRSSEMNRTSSANSSSAADRPWVPCLAFYALLLTLSGIASAQTDASPLPSHAQVSRYGSGWDCLPGYDREAQTCVSIEVPPNAYLNSLRNRWECNRGYIKASKQCVAVKVPENAYAEDTPFGTGWRCNRGYHQTERGCTVILVPENAYPVDSSYGRGWECNRGYRPVGPGCAPTAASTGSRSEPGCAAPTRFQRVK